MLKDTEKTDGSILLVYSHSFLTFAWKTGSTMKGNQHIQPCFLELSFRRVPPAWSEILLAELAGIGFDSFNEEEEMVLAYIPEEDFDEMAVHQVLNKYPNLKEVLWSMTRMPDRNWNEVWESAYEPVLIAGRCYIRAPFHQPSEAVSDEIPGNADQESRSRHSASLFDIVIEPKMSFGTAHHETTALMIEWLLDETVTGDRVLDMGCGTGVLAILACKMGAAEVTAIDYDSWAYENTLENISRNHASLVRVIHGGIEDLPSGPLDLILANINRNTLVDQIPVYAESLGESGRLFMSGFYSEDLPAIEASAAKQGLRLAGSRVKNNWIAAKFTR